MSQAVRGPVWLEGQTLKSPGLMSGWGNVEDSGSEGGAEATNHESQKDEG